MTWFFVDDAFYDHPKVKAIPRGNPRKGAISLWTLAGSWSARYGQDGMIPRHMIDEFGASAKDADWLVAAELWHTADHGCPDCPGVPAKHYLFHDWPKFQKTKEQVEAERAAARERMAKLRRGKTTNGNEVTADVRPNGRLNEQVNA